MKKLIVFALVVVFLFSAVACSNIKKCETNNNLEANIESDVGFNDNPTAGISIEPNDSARSGWLGCVGANDSRHDQLVRAEYCQRFNFDTEELADFLLAIDELDNFVTVNHSKTRSEIIEEAATSLANNEEMHEKALERAVEAYSNMEIDADYEDLRDFYKSRFHSDHGWEFLLTSDCSPSYPGDHEPNLSNGINGPWGEHSDPILNGSNGSWDGPTD